MTAIIIPNGFKVTSTQFDELAESNTDVRMELTAQGELITMPPTGGSAGKCNFNLYLDLGFWNRSTGLGVAFDSSTIFILPNGARRSPDVAWVRLETWQSLTPEEQDGFPPLVPDFVIELVSPSDLKKQNYKDLQGKMLEYLENGVRLGWLIEPKTRKVEIYRQGQAVEILQNPKSLSGEDVLPSFVLNLDLIWS
ncbi:Uma2 family endonuclease [Euhalothece natronophila Z-M001]|uniref:Uma2 family endonuclease n=1 Tax=Euhalothece natronophila Z-M001 TaxID=522448 RepID=A0A5B8NJ50_9CHRO|nr:Uma2 family endonuclease [Euhalothece natronophila]QDZ39006.1 Uma2 family endonuclease [Euhalothece natronophila Z-M001]